MPILSIFWPIAEAFGMSFSIEEGGDPRLTPPGSVLA